MFYILYENNVPIRFVLCAFRLLVCSYNSRLKVTLSLSQWNSCSTEAGEHRKVHRNSSNCGNGMDDGGSSIRTSKHRDCANNSEYLRGVTSIRQKTSFHSWAGDHVVTRFCRGFCRVNPDASSSLTFSTTTFYISRKKCFRIRVDQSKSCSSKLTRSGEV